MIQSQVLSNNFEAEKRGNIKSMDKKTKKKQDKINYSIYETFRLKLSHYQSYSKILFE